MSVRVSVLFVPSGRRAAATKSRAVRPPTCERSRLTVLQAEAARGALAASLSGEDPLRTPGPHTGGGKGLLRGRLRKGADPAGRAPPRAAEPSGAAASACPRAGAQVSAWGPGGGAGAGRRRSGRPSSSALLVCEEKAARAGLSP